MWGSEGWVGGGRRKRKSGFRGNSVGYQRILLQLVEIKEVPINCRKMLLTIWKVKHCKGGGRVPTAAQKQQQTKAAAKAERSSCKPQQEHKQVEFRFCSWLSFWIQTKFVIIGHRLFRKSRSEGKSMGKSIVKLFLTFWKSCGVSHDSP